MLERSVVRLGGEHLARIHPGLHLIQTKAEETVRKVLKAFRVSREIEVIVLLDSSDRAWTDGTRIYLRLNYAIEVLDDFGEDAFIWLVGHEVAHILLRHRPLDLGDCAELHKQELSADDLSTIAAIQLGIKIQPILGLIRSFHGACSHPTGSERARNVQAIWHRHRRQLSTTEAITE